MVAHESGRRLLDIAGERRQDAGRQRQQYERGHARQAGTARDRRPGGRPQHNEERSSHNELGVGHVQDDLARRQRTVELPATQGDRPEPHAEKYAADEEKRTDDGIGQHRRQIIGPDKYDDEGTERGDRPRPKARRRALEPRAHPGHRKRGQEHEAAGRQARGHRQHRKVSAVGLAIRQPRRSRAGYIDRSQQGPQGHVRQCRPSSHELRHEIFRLGHHCPP